MKGLFRWFSVVEDDGVKGAREKVGNVLAVLALFGCWGYFLVHFGVVWGLTLGWLPAFVIAVLVGYFWPYALVLAAAASILLYLYPMLGHLSQIV